MKPALSIVVAMDENNLIGAGNGIPWHLPGDLRHFKTVTMGKPMLMGRKTFESLPGLLPGRRHLILTRDQGYSVTGAEIMHTLGDALAACHEDSELMVIGGAEIYRLALPLCQYLYLTRVHHSFDGDTWFPEVDWREWRELARHKNDPDLKNTYAHTFIEYERIPGV